MQSGLIAGHRARPDIACLTSNSGTLPAQHGIAGYVGKDQVQHPGISPRAHHTLQVTCQHFPRYAATRKPLILLGFSRHGQLSYCDTDCHCLPLFVKIGHLSSMLYTRRFHRRSLYLAAFSQKFTYSHFILHPFRVLGNNIFYAALAVGSTAAPCALCRSGLRRLVQTWTRGGRQKGRKGQGDRWTIAEVYFRGRG